MIKSMREEGRTPHLTKTCNGSAVSKYVVLASKELSVSKELLKYVVRASKELSAPSGQMKRGKNP